MAYLTTSITQFTDGYITLIASLVLCLNNIQLWTQATEGPIRTMAGCSSERTPRGKKYLGRNGTLFTVNPQSIFLLAHGSRSRHRINVVVQKTGKHGSL
jgi:hypothetical protein